MKYFKTTDNSLIPDGTDEIIIPEKSLRELATNLDRNLTITYLPTPIENRDDYLKACDYVLRLNSKILDSIKNWLSSCYDIELSLAQLGYIYNMYLLRHIYDVYIKYMQIKKYDVGEWTFKSGKPDILPVTCQDMDVGMDYQAYIYAVILKHFGAHNIDGTINTKVNNNSILYHYVRNELRRVVNCIPKRDVSLKTKIQKIHAFLVSISGFPRRIEANSLLIRTFLPRTMEKAFVIKSKGKIARVEPDCFYPLISKGTVNRIQNKTLRRQMLSGLDYNKDFETILLRTITDTMPLELCENFYSRYKDAQKITKYYFINKIYSAGVHDGFFSAVMNKKGSQIIDIQHSGLYGLTTNVGLHEYNTYDEFLTWGWEVEDNKKIRAVAPVRFFAKDKQPLNNDINRLLLVLTMPPYYKGIIYGYCDDYLNSLLSFIRDLDYSLRKKLVVRYRFQLYNIEEDIKSSFPEVTLENSRNISMEKSVYLSDVVIVDNVSSPLYESLMLGKPVFIYMGFDLVFTECADRWLEKLNDAGLYRYNGCELAEVMNKELNDIYSAFKDGEYNELINSFLDYFVGLNKDYKSIWYNEFIS